MADVDVGSLKLQIEAEAKNATDGIAALQKQLRALNAAVKNATALASVASNLRALGLAANAMGNVRNIGAAANALNTLSGIKISKTVANNLEHLKIALSGFDGSNASALSALAPALSGLATVDASGFNKTANAIAKLPSALAELNTVDIGASIAPLKVLSDALSGLQGGDASFNASANAIAKLPKALSQLENVDLATLAPRLREMADAMRPLADEMARIGAGGSAIHAVFGNISSGAKNATASLTGAAHWTNILSSRLNKLFSYAVWVRAYRILGGLVDKATEYVEDLNLFTVAMGDYAEEAQKYAETVSNTLGIDVSQWLRGQGVFMTLATGFGVASDRAAIMSKNLTQLAYDLSSFYNLNVDEAFKKLESGFAGEIEPVRRLGYDLSKTTLQATAASLGITKLFSEMTQAEKSQLRYYALMTQVTQVQGDMARTLEAPANQLRILRAQLEMAGRALGSIFIPLLNAVLPYLIAAAKFVRLLAEEVARFFGYELPEIDYSGINVGSVTEDVDDLDNALGGAAGRAKELKNLLAGFDELNIITSETGGGGGGGAGGISAGGGWNDFELPQYDFLNGVISSKVDAIFERMRRSLDGMRPVIKWIKDNFDAILNFVKAIGLGLLAWKVTSGIGKLLQTFGLLKNINFGKIAGGISLMVGGFGLEFMSARNIGAGRGSVLDYIQTALGSALGIGGSLLLFGTGPLGWTIGIGASITVLVSGIVVGQQDKLRQQVQAAFFNGVGKPISEIARKYSESFDAITISVTPVLELGDSIGEIDKNISKARTGFAGLMQSLEDGSIITPEKTAEIQAAFDELYAGMELRLTSVNELIRDSLVVAMQNAATDVGISTNAILGQLALISGKEEQRLRAMKAEVDNLIESMTGLEVGSAQYEEAEKQLGALTRQMALLTGSTLPAVGSFERLKETIKNEGLDLQNLETAQASIEKIGNTAKEAKDALVEAWERSDNEILSKIKAWEDLDPEVAAFYRRFREYNKEQFDAAIGEIDRDVLALFAEIDSSLALGVEKVFADASVKDNANAAQEYANSIVTPLSDEMLRLLELLGIDGELHARQAIEGTIGGLISGMNASGLFYKSLDDLNREMGTYFTDMPSALAHRFRGAWSNEVPGMEAEISASGKRIGDAFGSGMTTALERQFKPLSARLRNWYDKISLTPSHSGGGPSFDFGSLNVPAFAGGGFPRAGSLFLAGEAGPEIVGSMGGNTAVANGNQITAGIANGVAMANVEQNRLLREQNELLRELLARGGDVVFTPTAEAGGVINRALEMYATQRGY